MTGHLIAVSYIPKPDEQALAWLKNLAATLDPRPTAFGVDALQLAVFHRLIREFEARHAEAGQTRQAGGRAAVAGKIRARNLAVMAAQQIVQQIQAHPLITDEDLARFGLPVRPAKPRKPARQPAAGAKRKTRKVSR